MRHVAIIGSSSITDINFIESHLPEEPDFEVVVSNGAIGVSAIAQSYAQKHGLKFLAFYSPKVRGGPLKRDNEIGEVADEGFVFWDCESSGAAHIVESLTYRSKKCNVFIYGEPKKPHSGSDIKGFNKGNFWLNNLWPCEVSVADYVFPSLMNAYNASGFYRDRGLVKRFERVAPLESAALAKKLREECEDEKDIFWSAERYPLMERLVERKFKQNEYLMKKLILTGNSYLINECNDKYWGIKEGSGENKLGEIIMRFRSKISK